MKIKSIFTNSFGILISRVLGFIRDMIMASTLGVNIFSDIFAIAFKLPNLFRRIFAEGAFVQSFLPSFVASKHKGVFSTAIVIRFLIFIVLGSIVVNIFSDIATKAIAIGFNDETVALASPLVAINFWYLDLIFLITFLATLLQYKEHFATTSFSTSLLNISMIGAMIIYAKDDPIDIVYALSFSVLIGGVLQLIAHIIAIKRFNLHKLLIGGWRYRKEKDVTVEKRDFISQFIPAMWGNSTAQITAFLDTWMASFLITGSISYLYYANRIFQLPLAIFAIATATVLFPSISKSIKNGKSQDVDNSLNKAFWILAFTLGLATVGGTILSQIIVWLLFERGEFTTIDRVNSANILVMYMIGLLPFGLSKLFSLFLYTSKRQGKAAIIATYSLLVNLVLSFILMQYMGAMGLALASSIGGWVLLILTIKEVGFKKFQTIIQSKNSLYFIAIISIFSYLLLYINNILEKMI